MSVAPRSTIGQRQPTRMEVAAGATLPIAVLVGLVAPRSFTYLSLLISATAIAAAIKSGSLDSGRQIPWRMPLFFLFAFCLFSAASAFWSPFPGATIRAALLFAAICGFSAGTVIVISNPLFQIDRRTGAALSFIVAITGLALVVDIYSMFEIRRWIVNGLPLRMNILSPTMYRLNGNAVTSIDPSIVNRSLVSLAIFIWPALYMTAIATNTRYFSVGLYLIVLLACFLSGSQTAQLQMVLSTVAFLASLVSDRHARRLLLVAWVSACALVVPLMTGLHGLRLHKSNLVTVYGEGFSPAARIAIGHQYATRVIEAPFLGHGAAVSRELKNSSTSDHKMPAHPHNAYLQLWFELGAVGIGLFMGFGLSMINMIIALPSSLHRFAYAQFASAAVLLAPSYGFWQPWQTGMICLSVILMVAARCMHRAY